MKRAAFITVCAVVAAALPGSAQAAQPGEPGCFGQYHALAAHVLGGSGEMISSNCYVRRGNDGANLGQDFNPYLRDAVC